MHTRILINKPINAGNPPPCWLLLQGYISYPRTESSAYPPNFDLEGTLAMQRSHPLWGGYAAGLAAQGITRPKGGVDVVRNDMKPQSSGSPSPMGMDLVNGLAAGCICLCPSMKLWTLDDASRPCRATTPRSPRSRPVQRRRSVGATHGGCMTTLPATS